MKKLLSLLLCLCMLATSLALTACESAAGTITGEIGDIIDELAGKTPEELYADALATVSGLTNFRTDSKQEIKMSAQGQTATMHQTLIAMKDGHNEYVKTENDMNSSLNMEGWYIDNMFYAIQGDLKFKAEIAYEDYVEKYLPDGATSEGALLNIPESWFTDTKFVIAGENSYCLEFTVSGDQFVEYFEELGITQGASVAATQNVTYKVYFDGEGNLSTVITEFAMEIEGVTAEYYIETEISGIGTTVITPPADTEGWQDLTGRI